MSEKRELKRRDFLKAAAVSTAAMTLAPAVRVLGTNDRVRLGIIGPGGRGKGLMREALQCPGTEFVAIADVYERRHGEAQKLAPGVRTYFDYRKLLEHKDIDAILIATPLHLHARHFLDALDAGKDIYCEKTMTWSIDEAKQCRDAARKSNRVISIGMQHTSSSRFRQVKQLLSNQTMGKITQIRSYMSRNTPHNQPQWARAVPQDCTPDKVRWDLFQPADRPRKFDANRFMNWRFFWEYSGGNITENMVHQIGFWMKAMDLPVPMAATMCGGVFLWKDGREVPDTIGVTLQFPQEMVFTWTSNFGNGRYPYGDAVLGTDGTIEAEGDSAHYEPEKVTNPSGMAMKGSLEGESHMQNFIDCVRSRKEPNAPVELGYRSAVACHLANLAYREKRRVCWDATREMVC